MLFSVSVSYTHLDVYKRQEQFSSSIFDILFEMFILPSETVLPAKVDFLSVVLKRIDFIARATSLGFCVSRASNA